jgi:hypothetical protein
MSAKPATMGRMKKAQIPAKLPLGRALAAACAAAILMLSACATPTAPAPAYRPQATAEGAGYADEQIDATRYRVSFSGDTETTRGQVEDYLLRRAAEITVRAGYNYFEFDKRSIETDTNLYRTTDNWDPTSGLAFGLGRRYPGRSEHFAKGSVPAFWSEKEAVPITHYTARSEIVMLPPDQLARHPGALAAREILRYLSPEFLAGVGMASAKANP